LCNGCSRARSRLERSRFASVVAQIGEPLARGAADPPVSADGADRDGPVAITARAAHDSDVVLRLPARSSRSDRYQLDR